MWVEGKVLAKCPITTSITSVQCRKIYIVTISYFEILTFTNPPEHGKKKKRRKRVVTGPVEVTSSSAATWSYFYDEEEDCTVHPASPYLPNKNSIHSKRWWISYSTCRSHAYFHEDTRMVNPASNPIFISHEKEWMMLRLYSNAIMNATGDHLQRVKHAWSSPYERSRVLPEREQDITVSHTDMVGS